MRSLNRSGLSACPSLAIGWRAGNSRKILGGVSLSCDTFFAFQGSRISIASTDFSPDCLGWPFLGEGHTGLTYGVSRIWGATRSCKADHQDYLLRIHRCHALSCRHPQVTCSPWHLGSLFLGPWKSRTPCHRVAVYFADLWMILSHFIISYDQKWHKLGKWGALRMWLRDLSWALHWRRLGWGDSLEP